MNFLGLYCLCNKNISPYCTQMSQEKTFLIPKGDALEEPLRNCLNTTVIPSQYSEKAIVLLGPKCLNRACVKRVFPLLVPTCLNRSLL